MFELFDGFGLFDGFELFDSYARFKQIGSVQKSVSTAGHTPQPLNDTALKGSKFE